MRRHVAVCMVVFIATSNTLYTIIFPKFPSLLSAWGTPSHLGKLPALTHILQLLAAPKMTSQQCYFVWDAASKIHGYTIGPYNAHRHKQLISLCHSSSSKCLITYLFSSFTDRITSHSAALFNLLIFINIVT